MRQITKLPTKDQLPTSADFPNWANPTNLYYESEWMMLRDCLLGEKQVKSRGTTYVPHTSGFDKPEYDAFLDRASFYNIIARTVSGMLGTLFRRNPIATELPSSIDIENVGHSGESLWEVMRAAAQEVIHMSRVGALVDRAPDGSGDPYIVLYPVESIIDWTETVVNGRKIPTDITLREAKVYGKLGQANVVRTEYRRLVLENGIYKQYKYNSTEDTDADILGSAVEIIPTLRGNTMDSIPFEFINATNTKAEVERPYLGDIARINISHFRSSAHLEHGRFFTGQPVYYTRANSNDNTVFEIGASTIWKLPQDGTAGIIEFNGTGLLSLERALTQKENHASALGGRLIGMATGSTAESDNMTNMKERNENALLLNIAFTLDSAFTRMLKHIAKWSDESDAVIQKIEVECSKDFMLAPVGAREFRAMHMLYTDGIIPIDVVFDYLRRAEVIPDWLEEDEFKRLLESKNAFPAQPNAEARMDGYPNMKAKLDEKIAEKELEDNQKAREDALKAQREQQRRQEVAPPRGTRPDNINPQGAQSPQR